jgi:methylglutaconyl-CoA hydratase
LRTSKGFFNGLKGDRMAHYESIRIRSEADVRTIILNRPDRRNALTPRMIDELTHALEEASTCGCGALILTGAGSAFCAGLDLEHLATMHQRTAEEHQQESESIARLLRTLYDLPKPTIAAVNGAAIAGGMGIATVCDFTLAVPEARFGYTEARIGFIPAIVASFLLMQVGEKRARDLMLTARLLTAQEALDFGLLTRIVTERELIREAEDLAQSLLRNSPESLSAIKQLLSRHAKVRLDRELAAAIDSNAEARSTKDFQEGIRAFLEKRPPVWPSRSHPHTHDDL